MDLRPWIILLLIVPSVAAQDFEINKSSFTSGGEVGKTGGPFEATGTIGVARSAAMSGGQFAVRGSMQIKSRTPECVEDIPGYNECFDETMGGSETVKHWSGELGLPGGREWGECMNWYENAIPADGDNACIPGDVCQDHIIYRESDTILNSLASSLEFVIDGSNGSTRLELDEASSILGDVEMTGNATLSVDDNLLIDGKLIWRRGTIDGVGTTEVTDGMAIVNNSVTLSRGDLRLTGGVGRNVRRVVSMNSGATFEIGTDATFEYEGDSAMFVGGSGLVDVRGSFVRTEGDGDANIQTPVNNSGLIHNQTGEFYLYHPATHTGEVRSDPGTLLGLQSDQMFMPSSTLTAETLQLRSSNDGFFHGTVDIAERIDGVGGRWTFADDANIVSYGQHVYVERGRVNFFAPVDEPIDLQSVTITTPGESSGTIEFDTGQPVNVVDFTMVTGSLYGSSPINISGEFRWTRGSFWPGGAITADGPVVFNATSSSRSMSRVLNINDQAIFRSGFSLSSGGRLNIAPGVVVDFQTNGGGVAGGVITNDGGTVLRTVGDGEISINGAIINDGLFHNQTGTFSFATHPLNGSSTYTGDIISDPGAILKFAGANHDLQSTSTMTAENLLLWAGSSTCHGSVNISDGIECDGCGWTFAPDADIIDYGDHVTIRRGTMRFEAPTDREISFDTVTIPVNFNSSSLYLDTGQQVNINELAFLDAGSVIHGSSPIRIVDAFTWSNGSIFAGGVITSDGVTTINPTSSSRSLSRPFINNGTMVFRGGFGFSGSGRIDNNETGLIDFRYDGRATSSRSINNSGTLIRTTNDGVTLLQNTDLNNEGVIDIQQGTLEVTTALVTQMAGGTIINAGTMLDLSTSDPFALQGGLFKGDGQYLGDLENSGGAVAPGTSIGQLMIDGDYDQPGGALDIEIDDTGSDMLTISGSATLGGTLVVTHLNAFAPKMTDEFVILEAADVSGEFTDLSIPPVYEVHYNPTNVTLTIAAVSPDLNGDGVVNLLDFQLFQECFNGSGNLASANCDPAVDADFDQDGDVDLFDFERLATATSP